MSVVGGRVFKFLVEGAKYPGPMSMGVGYSGPISRRVGYPGPMSAGSGVVIQVPCLGEERGTLTCDLFHGAFDVS